MATKKKNTKKMNTERGEIDAMLAPPISEPAPRELLLTDHIAGFQYHHGQLVKPVVGDVLLLIAEPSNQHDSNAIKIVHQNTALQLGYVKRDSAKLLHQLKARGYHNFTAAVNAYNPSNPSWQACTYRVWADLPTAPRESLF